MEIYTLTREHNQYEQEGEYLVAVFTYLPSVKQIQDILVNDGAEYNDRRWLNSEYITWLVSKGGGRPSSGWDVWYFFRRFEGSEVDFTAYS